MIITPLTPSVFNSSSFTKERFFKTKDIREPRTVLSSIFSIPPTNSII